MVRTKKKVLASSKNVIYDYSNKNNYTFLNLFVTNSLAINKYRWAKLKKVDGPINLAGL